MCYFCNANCQGWGKKGLFPSCALSIRHQAMLEWQTVFEYETINSDRGSKTVCWKVCAHLRVSTHEAGGQFDLKLIRVFLLMWPESLLQSPLKTACLPACTWVHLSVTGKSNNAAQLSPWLFFADGKNLSQFHTIKKKAELHSNIHSHRQNYLSANKRVSVHCEITFWQRLHVSVCTSYWCIPKGCVCQQPNFL